MSLQEAHPLTLRALMEQGHRGTAALGPVVLDRTLQVL